MIRDILSACWTFLERLFRRLFEFLGSLFGKLFQTLFDFLKVLLRPIFIVIALVLYVVYKIAELAIALLKLFLGIAKLLVMFVKGIFVTLAGFTFTPSARSDGSWTPIFKNVLQNGLNYFQLDTLAYVLMFCIWFATGFAAIRIIGSIRNGGD
ncbi:hypothetical protein EHV15_36205 [Paenibacillus oralis]|uniref:Uncharacterized protein n=1 Tax=Paenibacillus oralis TaxID=2490856 RepID=A0A3P3T7J5_9BACL|nr:hypothetical protein [Paenibacillus oralis]RRJ54006.1 hypothetical protein EHV15_36205 [Paenibacillus oralis]